MTARVLMLIAMFIVLLLGSVHLLYTFVGGEFLPREPQLRRQMESISPKISAQTSMWKAWVGFNASHSLGVMVFALTYGYLALCFPQMLFAAGFLLTLGALMLMALLLLALRYWFVIPQLGIALALLCYLGAVVLATVG